MKAIITIDFTEYLVSDAKKARAYHLRKKAANSKES